MLLKVQTKEPLKAYGYLPFSNQAGEPMVITLADLIQTVMNRDLPEFPHTAESIYRCGMLATKVGKDDEVELDEDDRNFIKDRAVKVYARQEQGPLYYMLIHEALTPQPEPALPDETAPKLEAEVSAEPVEDVPVG